MNNKIHVCSLNCQGLAAKDKRQRVYLWMKNQQCNVMFIQESHFTENIQSDIQKEFKGQIIFNHGNSQSRGVAILIKDHLNAKIIDVYKDEDGRLIVANVEIEESIYTLVNVYAPNIPRIRNSFFKKVKTSIEENSSGLLIVGGDMNDILTDTDTKNKQQKRKSKPVYGLKNLIKSFKLLDIWRELNTCKNQYTWKRKSNNNEATRIDYFLIGPELRTQIESADIRPAIISHTDHQAISLKIKGREKHRGKGYFKINNSILNNEEYKKLIKNIITKFSNEAILTNNFRTQWDLFKSEAKSRKYQGVFEVKSRVKTWQVRGIWSQQLEHKQVPKWGTEPGVRKGKRSLLASHTRCKCSMETTHNSVKVKFGIKVMKLVESLIGWEVTVGQGSECHLTFVRGILHIAE